MSEYCADKGFKLTEQEAKDLAIFLLYTDPPHIGNILEGWSGNARVGLIADHLYAEYCSDENLKSEGLWL